jgi:hypothetical protein
MEGLACVGEGNTQLTLFKISLSDLKKFVEVTNTGSIRVPVTLFPLAFLSNPCLSIRLLRC